MSLVDSFDSYTNGNLTGQGPWSGDTTFQVQGTVVQAGTKAVSAAAASADKNITASFPSAEATGAQIFYFQVASGSNRYAPTRFLDQSATSRAFVYFFSDDHIYFNVGGSEADLGTYTYDAWHKVRVEWRISDGAFRCQIDDGTFSTWDATSAGWTTINSVLLNLQALMTTGTVYWDSFSDPNVTPPSSVVSSANHWLLMGV